MGWATQHIARLQQGESVSFRPRGNSMKGKIDSGQLCTVAPGGAEYLHLVKAIQGTRFQIGNNRGGLNGWIGPHSIFGKCAKIED